MTSIEDDDGTTEYDVTEHLESLQHGIPDHFGMLQCCSKWLLYGETFNIYEQYKFHAHLILA